MDKFIGGSLGEKKVERTKSERGEWGEGKEEFASKLVFAVGLIEVEGNLGGEKRLGEEDKKEDAEIDDD